MYMVARKTAVFRSPYAKPPNGCLNQIKLLIIRFVSGFRLDQKLFLQLSQEKAFSATAATPKENEEEEKE